ncbi:hypothetical protein C1H69_22315 [Billgrantia endophytica]|uniref:Peptidase inhibitor I78 family protein n=2 Tax=Billgrantia endophytica TaxID=2033802 RepID=A0A2N7TVC9_9GAMM|nr:hypothetical protein C1H69_22315 [Halomonas endophytica]
MTQTNGPREPAPEPPRVSEEGDTCGASRVQDRVGRQFDEALGESMREQSGAGTIRVMRPGHAYTLEYRADRLNVRVDDNEVITDIGCG